jgi:5''-3'' exonuclease (including N-terminal domain of PolI)
MPKPMVPQLDFIQELTPLLGFRNISLPNTEADDLMGCYAIAACKRAEMEVVLATNDKDLYQLVGPCVRVYTTAKAELASPKDAFALLGEDQVSAKWEVRQTLSAMSSRWPAIQSTTSLELDWAAKPLPR